MSFYGARNQRALADFLAKANAPAPQQMQQQLAAPPVQYKDTSFAPSPYQPTAPGFGYNAYVQQQYAPPPSPILAALSQQAAPRALQQQQAMPLYETPAWQGRRRGTGGLGNEQVGFQWSPEATGNSILNELAQSTTQGSLIPTGGQQGFTPKDSGFVTGADMNYLNDLYATQGYGSGQGQGIDPYTAETTRIAAQAGFAEQNQDVLTNGQQTVDANNARIAEIESESAAIDQQLAATVPVTDAPDEIGGAAPGVTPIDPNTGQPIPNSTVGGPEAAALAERKAALAYERSQIEAQNQVLMRRILIAQGDTYQGRPNPGTGVNATTALNVMDAGRETTVTQMGDQAVQMILTGQPPTDLAVLSGDEEVGLIESALSMSPFSGFGGTNRTGAINQLFPDTLGQGGSMDATWIVGYIKEHPEKRNEMLSVYYSGFDADGDGMVDYVGGRAVWEWYAGEMSTLQSAFSQIVFDPSMVTVILGGAVGPLSRAAQAASIAGKSRTAFVLAKAARGMEIAASLDDPIWWVTGGPIKGGLSRWGRKIGIKESAGEAMSAAERQAASAAMSAGDTSAIAAMMTTPSANMPIHNPVTINGTQVQQVGNSGTTFISQNADGTFTVYDRSAAGGGLTPVNTNGVTQAEATALAIESEQAYVAGLMLSGDPAKAAQAAAYDSAVPVVYQGTNATVGYNGEIRVVFDAASNTYTVQVNIGNGVYRPTGGTYSDPASAMNAAQANYTATGGSGATGGGVTVQPGGGSPFFPSAPSQPLGGPTGANAPASTGVSPTGAANAITPPNSITPPTQGMNVNPTPGTVWLQPGQPLTTPNGVTANPVSTQGQSVGGGAWSGRYNDGSEFFVLNKGNGTADLMSNGVPTQTVPEAQVANLIDRINLTKGGSTVSPPINGQGQLGLAPSGQGAAQTPTGAADTVTGQTPLSQTPEGVPLDPSLSVYASDLQTGQAVTRQGSSYTYLGVQTMDGQPVVFWEVVAPNGYIYNVGTTSQSDGALRVEFTGEMRGPDGNDVSVGQGGMVNVSGVNTLNDTSTVILKHSQAQGPPATGGIGTQTNLPGTTVIPSDTSGVVNAGGNTTPPDPSVSPLTGEGPVGGRPVEDTVGDVADTGAASVAPGGSPVVPEQSVDNLTRQGRAAADLSRQGQPDPNLGRQGAPSPRGAADDAVSASVFADNPASVVPAGAAPSPASVAPSPGSATPSGAAAAPQGMYGGAITARSGSTVTDYNPAKVWYDEAVRVVDRGSNDLTGSQALVSEWVNGNPRIQKAQAEFADAIRSGDEVDQALAAMNLQATMAEEWVTSGPQTAYGPVIGSFVSPGAAGLSPGASTFPSEWPKTGRAIERIASNRPGQYDVRNLAKSGFLSGGQDELVQSLQAGRFPDWATSTGGRKFILPDGKNRLFEDEFLRMNGAEQQRVIDQIMANAPGGGLRNTAETQARLDDLADRFKAIEAGKPRAPKPEEMAAAPTTPPKTPKASDAPDADTKLSKKHAETMDVSQRKARVGKPTGPTDTVNFRSSEFKNRRSDDSYNPIPQSPDEIDMLYGGATLRDVDPTDRFDIVHVTSQGNGAKFYSLRGPDGRMVGWGKTKKDLIERIEEARGDISFLRIFDGGTQIPIATNVKGPSNLFAAITKANYGNAGGTARVLKDADGVFHVIVEDSFGKRVGVINSYGSLADARTGLEKAIQTGGGLDGWQFYGPDGGPLFTQGLGGASANLPFNWPLGKKTVKPTVPNPKNDGTLAGNLFDRGLLDESGYKTLLSKYVRADGTEVVVQDQIIKRMVETGSLDRAFGEVLDEFATSFKVARTGKKTKGGVVFDAVNESKRASMLYAIHRFLAGMFGDMGGNTYTNILKGYGPVNLFEQGRDLATGAKVLRAIHTGQWDVVEDTHRLFVSARQNNVPLQIGDFGEATKLDIPMHGDMPYSRGLQKLGAPRGLANVLTEPLQSRLARTGRNWNDGANRLAIGTVEYDRQLLKARSEMVKVVNDEAARLGEDAMAWAGILRAQGNEINAAGLRTAFNNNPIINMAWKAQTGNIRDGVLDALKKVTFVGGRTNVDDWASKVMFFHYWNSRAVMLHAEVAAKNPILIRLYAEAYEDAKEKAENLGLPSWLQTWTRFMGSANGWMGFFNPIGLVVPLFMFAEMGFGAKDDFERKFGDYILDLGAMSPWIEAAFTVAGQVSRAPDVTGTTGIRNIARAVINWARAEGIGPIDKFMSPVGDPLDSLQDDFWNWMSKNVGEAMLGGEEVQQSDPRNTDLKQLNLLTDEKMTELYGPDWRNDPALVAMANAAKASYETGEGGNAVSESVYTTWTGDKAEQAFIKFLMPGQTQFVYGPQAMQQQLAGEGFDAIDRGAEPTPEQQAAMDALRDNSLTTGARDLSEQLDGWYDVGTTFQRELHSIRSDLIYEDAPDNSWVIINDGENYSFEEWNAMSTDDRKDAMDRWVAEQGGTDQLAAYHTERDAYKASHPEMTAYLDWRDQTYDNPQGIHDSLMQTSPGYAEYIENLENPDDQDDWFTPNAYYASLGQAFKLTDNPDAAFDPTAANPLNELTGYMNTPQEAAGGGFEDSDRETYGSGEWKTKKEWQQNAPAEYIEAMQDEYESEVQAVQPVVDDVLEANGYGWMAGMSYQELEATAQTKGTVKAYDDALKAVKNELYRVDMTVPSTDAEIKDYERWKAQQQAADANADVSPQAFEQAKFAGQQQYGVGVGSPENVQAAENQQRADFFAANPTAEPYGPNGGFWPKQTDFGRYVPTPQGLFPGRSANQYVPAQGRSANSEAEFGRGVDSTSAAALRDFFARSQ